MSNDSTLPRPRRKSRSLAQDLVAELTRQIREGQIKRGEKLPTESEIMEAHGVSRTVVREAISRLQASGTVETRHGIGTFVLDTPSTSGFRIDPATIVTLRDVMAILELRVSLEVECAGLAARRRSAEQLAAMRAALDTFNRASQASDAVASDFQFHMQIALAVAFHVSHAFAFEPERTELPGQQSVQPLDHFVAHGDLCPDKLVEPFHARGGIDDIAGRPIFIMIHGSDGPNRQFTGMQTDACKQTIWRHRLIKPGHGLGHLQRSQTSLFAQSWIILRSFPNG